MNRSVAGLRARLNYALAEKLTRRDIRGKEALLAQWRAEDAERRRARLAAALASTVEYAAVHVPYYRDLFQRIRFDPGKLRGDTRYFADIPLLTKEIILSRSKEFLSTEFDRDSLHERKTSGSTGLTLSFYYSKQDLDWASAAVLFLNATIARDMGKREVHLSFAGPADRGAWATLTERAKLLALNRANITLAEVDSANVAACWRALRAEKPYLVYGLPSTLKALIQFAGGRAEYRGAFSLYVSSGETLDKRTAELIVESVGCRLINRYGNAEFGAIAQSAADPLALDFVDGIAYPENFVIGEYPEIVLTTLVGRAMPLIRYRTGDLGLVTSRPDGGYGLSAIQGRLHDIVRFGEKTYTTAFFRDFLHANFRIHDFQIVQKGEAAPEFRVITDHPEELAGMRDALVRLVRGEVAVSRIRPTDLIRRGRQMKYLYYVRQDAA